MAQMSDERGLDKCEANFVPLSPMSHLIRAAQVFSDHEAVVDRDRRHSYAQHYERCTRFGSALIDRGIKPGDVVSIICPNTLPMIESSFGVPNCGAVLNTINMRLDADTIAYIFEHSETRLVLVDTEFLPTAEEALNMMDGAKPIIIEISDRDAGFAPTGRYEEYEDFIQSGAPDRVWRMPDDEWDAIALNYTSGTTGRPKGVVYHSRGAYLMTMGTIVSWQLPRHPRFLAIVPLFHCNGWCHTWMMPAVGGTVVGCRNITADYIFRMLETENVSHFGGAPIVLNMLINASDTEKRTINHPVSVMTAGAPPSPATIQGIEGLGFEIMQVYGLTETYGHITECMEQPNWSEMGEGRFTKMARQGINLTGCESVDVVDTETKEPVPHDGETLGEIVIRGNVVMRGYYKNPEATKEAFEGGAFRSGDIAYRDEQGYIQIADRLKDIIISGGENISSVEVEAALMSHPAVSLCAIVARPDEKWGETPCAFVELIEGSSASADELIAHCRSKLSGFKCPKTVIYQELPKTATGKIQKNLLRDQAKSL